MSEDNIHLVNKIFKNNKIRTIWNQGEEKYYISVVDIVGILTGSEEPRNYWKVLKHRLKKEGNESVTNCNQLKLKSTDGKYYKTDVVDIEGMFRIIESIPSKNAEGIKLWLAKLGKDNLEAKLNEKIVTKNNKIGIILTKESKKW